MLLKLVSPSTNICDEKEGFRNEVTSHAQPRQYLRQIGELQESSLMIMIIFDIIAMFVYVTLHCHKIF